MRRQKKGVIIRMKTEVKIKESIRSRMNWNWSWREGKVRNGDESCLLVWDSRRMRRSSRLGWLVSVNLKKAGQTVIDNL
jgi:hypothetical protein